MLYFCFRTDKDQKNYLVDVIDEDDLERFSRGDIRKYLNEMYDDQVICPEDYNRDSKLVAELAQEATTLKREKYLAVDRGEHISPRYTVIKAPKVGDKISRTINGDYYPCGEIAKISESCRRIESTEGRVFWRRRQSDSWVNDGVWSMVQGHINRRNPEF